MIDTFLDARSGYFFEMNPSGLMADSIFNTNGDNRAWDGIWNARVRHNESGWTIEIESPLRTLNFDPSSDTWGINFQRTIRRKNEETIWTGWARNQGLRRMTNAGLVTGISGVTQGHGLDIKPYRLVSAQTAPGGGAGTETDASAGLDLFYNPTPLIRANLTVNTDFAQTEVDQRQVNLTRFSLFFPEQRDFFLDGAIYFDFASGGGGFFQAGGSRILPFFSRRIGLSADATPQKIDFGTKVMGQMGGQDVGLLHVRTGEDEGQTAEDFAVARVKRRRLAQSYVGALYTRRDPSLGGSEASHTAGLDFRLATSNFLGSQNLETSGWFLHATRPGMTNQNNAFGLTINYPNDRWSGKLDLREVQGNFAVGFVNRQAYRSYSPSVEFSPRPANHPYIRRFQFGAEVEMVTDLQNELLERAIGFTLLGVQLHTQDNFNVSPGTEPRAARRSLSHRARDRATGRQRVRFHAFLRAGTDGKPPADCREHLLRDRQLLFRHAASGLERLDGPPRPGRHPVDQHRMEQGRQPTASADRSLVPREDVGVCWSHR